MIAFYTYLHRHADDGKVFYVGKGKGKRARSSDGRNKHWHNVVKHHGFTVEIVAHFSNENDAFDHERGLIAAFRLQGVKLCNQTDGGDGVSGRKCSDETKQKISAGNSGKKRTAEQIRRNSEARHGRPVPESTRAKIAEANKGHAVTAETRAKISAAHIGKKNSPEARIKISLANKGRVRTPECRANVSASLIGRPVSQETRAALSRVHKGRVVSPATRQQIAKTLTGRRLSNAEKERRHSLTHSAERCARHSAVMKGRPWSVARRAAQPNKVQSF